jgi:hypothetical protein
MRNVLSLLLLVPVLALAAGNGQPVTALDPEGGVMNTAPAVAPVDQGRVTIPPKALVGTIDTIGGTTYDWWTNGPGLRMIKNAPGFGVHALWMWSLETSGTAFTDRNMRYNYYDYAARAWSYIDPADYMQSGVNTFTHRSGYGNIDASPTDGAAIVGGHYSGTAGVAPKVAKDAAPGAGIFDYADGEPVLGVCQWPPVAVDQNGAIHIFPITAGYQMSYSRINAGNWPTFEAPILVDPTPGFPTHNIAASKTSNKVALVWMNSAATPGEGYLQTSTDGGLTWGTAEWLDAPAGYGTDTTAGFHITSMSAFYDPQDRLNVVANINPIVRDTEWIIPSQIWHYSPDNTPQWNRISTAGCDPANLGAAVGYNASYACRPSMGADDDGHLYVAWEQFDSANVEVGPPARLRADIFVSGSSDAGLTWTPALKLTEAGTNSMRFPSMIDRAVEGDPDTLFIVYEIDQLAGFFIQGEGAATNNVVAVHRVPVTEVGIAEPGHGTMPVRVELSATPNPLTARTRISYAVPRAGDVSLVVYDAAGRPVQTLASGRREAGRYSANWDAAGAANGVYFYTLTSGKASVTKKLTLAR